jgi:ubiquinone/menaquinone biosynthesis C-methylase UbiE
MGKAQLAMKQAEAFYEGEGDAWLKRNIHKLPPEHDPVQDAIEHLNITPTSVLEIGCANGWRLEQLFELYKCKCWGVDPALGFPYGPYGSHHRFTRTTADNLSPHLEPDQFDLVIYGFCLYLCDPDDYFRIAMEGDRVLQDNGHLIIHDFYSETPKRVPYHHKDGLFSHKMDFRKLWDEHPYYLSIGGYSTDQNEVMVGVLKKRRWFG